jgi:hypothetical protein
MKKRHLYLMLSLATVASAQADESAKPKMIETCPTCQVTTLGDLVENRMSQETRADFQSELCKAEVPYDAVKDMKLTYDARSGSLKVQGDPAKHPLRYMVFVGVHAGPLLLPFGMDGIAMVSTDGRPRWDIDASWEPSGYRQSYSVGGAFHPFHGAFFVGARIREMQMHAPWSDGYNARFDNEWGGGLETGFRGRLFNAHGDSRILGSFSVGAFYVTNAVSDLPVMYTLNVGLAYGVAGN